MKKEYDKKKRTIVIVLAVCAVCLAAGLCLYLSKIGRAEMPERDVLGAEKKETQVTVPEIEIPAEEPSAEPENEAPAETEPLAGTEQAGEDGEQEDTGDSAETTPEPPEVKDKEALTDPSQEPQYEPEVTQPEQKPEEPAGGTANSTGQVYVPGFGYVDPPGAPQGTQADSSGDWDKQIGNMN